MKKTKFLGLLVLLILFVLSISGLVGCGTTNTFNSVSTLNSSQVEEISSSSSLSENSFNSSAEEISSSSSLSENSFNSSTEEISSSSAISESSSDSSATEVSSSTAISENSSDSSATEVSSSTAISENSSDSSTIEVSSSTAISENSSSNQTASNSNSSTEATSSSNSTSSSEHTCLFTNYKYNNDATCTTDGTETGTCSCNKTHTRTAVGSATHLYGDLQAKVEPTCTQTGTYAHYKCSRCSEYFDSNKNITTLTQITIAKLDHKHGTAVEENRVNSTCTKAGSYESVVYCSYGCNTELSRTVETIAKLDHKHGTAVEENRVNSTCTKAGSYDSVVYCSYGCNTELSRTVKTIAKLDHKHGTAVEENRVNSTCTKAGSYDSVVYCSYGCNTELSRTHHSLALAEHSYGSLISAKAATCTTAGNVEHYKCSACNKYFNTNKTEISSITVSAKGHSYGSLISAKAATCTTAGNVEHYKCSSCNKYFNSSKTEISSITVAAKGHNYGSLVAAKAATCTTAGNVEHYKCSSCNKYFNSSKTEISSITVSAKGHSYGSLISAKAATCTTAGNVEHYKCSACNKYFNTNKTEISSITVAAKGHSYGSLVAAKAATCTAAGNVAHYKCSGCNKYFNSSKTEISSITVAAKGHSYGSLVAAKAATCTAAGNVEHYKCSSCNKYFNSSKTEISSITVAAKGHSYGSLVAAKAATCTAAGNVAYYKCSSCSSYFDSNKNSISSPTIAAKGHSYGSLVAAKAATCTTAGNVAYYKCSSCNNYFDSNKSSISSPTIAAKGHNYGSLVAAKSATCTTAGNVEHYKCSSCNKYFNSSKTEISSPTIAAKGHSYGSLVAAKSATCTATGNVAYYKCSSCSSYFDSNKNSISSPTIAAKGHSYGSLVAAKAATCTASGNVAYYKCSTCSKYFNSSKTEISSPTVAAKGHSYDINNAQVSAGAFTSGTIAYKHCSSCNKTFNSSGTDITGQSLYIAPTSGFKTVKGSFSKGSGQVITTATTGSIALYAGVETVSKTNATLTVRVKHNNGPLGLVFNYTDTNNYYKFILDDRNGTDKIKLIRVKGGTETELYSNYLSAGYWSGNTNGTDDGDPFTFKLVIKNSVAYCYFWKTLYITQSLDMSGSGIGIYSGTSSTVTYNSYTYSNSGTIDTCNTLLFGHSYFEMWRNWKSDFATVSNNCSGFGTFIDIGIGGSVAQHWYNMRSTLLNYNFNNVVFMIGINDISGAYTPAQAFSYVKQTLDYLKQQKPNMKAVLVGVAQCPARDYIKNKISELNVLYKQYSLENSWVNFAECEWLFTNNGSYVASDFLSDNLHPSDSAYKNKLAPAIQKAWTGGYQSEILTHLKTIKASTLDIYSKNTYRAKEWEVASPIYNQAINAINNCTTYDQLKALSLDTWINKLNNIFTHSDYAFYNILETSPATAEGDTYYSYSAWENVNFKNTLETSYDNKPNAATSPSKYNLASYGHRLDTSVSYTDMSFTFSFSNGPTANNAGTDGSDKVGILFRTTHDYGTRGISGYAITYVKDAEGDGTDYFQILYLANCYSTSFNGTCRYLGGWVYKGNAENKTFRAVISGNTCYIYEESVFQTYGSNAYGCYALLNVDAGGGAVTPHNSGYWGLLNWGTHTAQVTVDNITGSAIHNADVEKAHNLIYSMSSGTNCTTVDGGFGTGAGPFITCSGKGYRVSKDTSYTNANLTFSVDADGDTEYAGIVLRASVTASGGISGYLLTPTSNGNTQTFNLWKLTNACAGSNEGYELLATWTFSVNSRNLKYIVDLTGNKFTITIEGFPGFIMEWTDNSITTPGYFGVFVNGNLCYVKVHNATFS